MFSCRKRKKFNAKTTESWWNRRTWKRKWRWNKNAGNKDVYSLSAFIIQMYAETVCSQRKSLERWLLRSWTRRLNSAFWTDPNFDDCVLLLILVGFWLWLQTHFVFSPFWANFCSATDMRVLWRGTWTRTYVPVCRIHLALAASQIHCSLPCASPYRLLSQFRYMRES